jgi:hypothetical protein
MSGQQKPAGRNKPRLRAGVHTTKVRTPTEQEFADMHACLEQLGPEFFAALSHAIGEQLGRPGSLTGRHAVAGWLLACFDSGSKGLHATAARNLLALTKVQRAALGIPEIPDHRVYARLRDKTVRVIDAVEAGFSFERAGVVVHVNREWFINAVTNSSIPPDAPRSLTVALDGTDWEAGAAWVHPKLVGEYDGAVPPDTDMSLSEHERVVRGVRKRFADLVETGPDGRPIYTTYREGRAGHRSANYQHPAGLYVGDEVHAAVQVPDFKYGGKPGQVGMGSHVPGYVRFVELSAAGSHRNNEVMPGLIATLHAARDHRAKSDPGAPLDMAVLLDRGYTCLSYESGLGRLAAAGIGAVFDLTKHQRGLAQKRKDIVWIDGTPFHSLMPKKLYDLPAIQIGDSSEVRAAKQKAFDQRARWRWTIIGRTENDKGYRLECPFCAGRLRATGLRQTKVHADSPTVTLPAGTTSCCHGRVSVPDDENHLAQAQGMAYGTTAQRTVYNQRPQIENQFNVAKHQMGNLNRDYTRFREQKKRSFALAFFFAGINRRIAVSEAAKEEARDDAYEARVAAWQAERNAASANTGLSASFVPTPRRAPDRHTGRRPTRSTRQSSVAPPRRI